jgi:uncharacterized sulfatase
MIYTPRRSHWGGNASVPKRNAEFSSKAQEALDAGTPTVVSATPMGGSQQLVLLYTQHEEADGVSGSRPRGSVPVFIQVVGFVRDWAALILALSTLAAAPLLAAPKPNVVLIISDDQAWTDYGFMGHQAIQTPNLDRLAAESLTFTRGYVPSSLCRPSLASIITGLYPHQHKIVGNDPAPLSGATAAESQSNDDYKARWQALIDHIDAAPTLPRLLAAAGYRSFQSGKWWEGNYRRGGFTHGMTRGFPEPAGRHGDDGLAIGREGLQPIFDFVHHAQRDGKPFFVWYAPLMPHAPHNAPPRLLSKYRDVAPTESIARYWAMCEWFDETCGQLLQFLDENGLHDNTLVAFVADNGWINLADSSAYAPRSKRSPYDGGLRTPIMIRYPRHVAAMMMDGTAVSSLDLAPTILHACGVQPTVEMMGINLADAAAVAKRATIFGEVFEHDVVDVDHPSASLRYRWIVQLPWKLIVPYPVRSRNAAPELFNLIDDPMEVNNLAGQHAGVRSHLQQQLNDWWSP